MSTLNARDWKKLTYIEQNHPMKIAGNLTDCQFSSTYINFRTYDILDVPRTAVITLPSFRDGYEGVM